MAGAVYFQDFETATTDSWLSQTGTGTVSRDTSTPLFGTGSLRVTPTGDSTPNMQADRGVGSCVLGEYVEARASFKSNVAGAFFRVVMDTRNSGGFHLTYYAGALVQAVNAGDIVVCELPPTEVTDAAAFDVAFWVQTSTTMNLSSGHWFQADDLYSYVSSIPTERMRPHQAGLPARSNLLRR